VPSREISIFLINKNGSQTKVRKSISFGWKQGCQIFLGTTNQNEKNVQNDHKRCQIT
jgi:hypothetical protein